MAATELLKPGTFDWGAEAVGFINTFQTEPQAIVGRILGLRKNLQSADNENSHPDNAYWKGEYSVDQDRHGNLALVSSEVGAVRIKGSWFRGSHAMIDSMTRAAALILVRIRQGETSPIPLQTLLNQRDQFDAYQRRALTLQVGQSMLSFALCGADVQSGVALQKTTKMDNGTLAYETRLVGSLTDARAQELLQRFVSPDNKMVSLDPDKQGNAAYSALVGNIDVDLKDEQFIRQTVSDIFQSRGEQQPKIIRIAPCQNCKAEGRGSGATSGLVNSPHVESARLAYGLLSAGGGGGGGGVGGQIASESSRKVVSNINNTETFANSPVLDNKSLRKGSQKGERLNKNTEVKTKPELLLAQPEGVSLFQILPLPIGVQISDSVVECIAPAEKDTIKPYLNIQTFDRVWEQAETAIPQTARQPKPDHPSIMIYKARHLREKVVEQKDIIFIEKPMVFKILPEQHQVARQTEMVMFKPQTKAEQKYQAVHETERETITLPLIEIPSVAKAQIGKMLEVEAEIIDEDKMGKMLLLKPGVQVYDQPVLPVLEDKATVVSKLINEPVTEEGNEEQDKPTVGKKIKVLAVKRLIVRPSLDLSSVKPDAVGVWLEIKKLIWVSRSDKAVLTNIMELELPKDQNQRLYSLLHFLRKMVKEKVGEDLLLSKQTTVAKVDEPLEQPVVEAKDDVLWQRKTKVMRADKPDELINELVEDEEELEVLEEIEYYFALLQERTHARVFAFAD